MCSHRSHHQPVSIHFQWKRRWTQRIINCVSSRLWNFFFLHFRVTIFEIQLLVIKWTLYTLSNSRTFSQSTVTMNNNWNFHSSTHGIYECRFLFLFLVILCATDGIVRENFHHHIEIGLIFYFFRSQNVKYYLSWESLLKVNGKKKCVVFVMFRMNVGQG